MTLLIGQEPEGLYGDRDEALIVERLDLDDVPLEVLDLVDVDFRLTRSIYDSIRTGGVMHVTEAEPIDWLLSRIRVTYVANGVEYPRGVFLPTTPTGPRNTMGGMRTIELYDKNLVLLEDVPAETYVMAAGAVVTDEVVALIQSANEERISVDESTETTYALESWAPEDSKLAIANSLLESINYVKLYVDLQGVFRIEPYVNPTKRPVSWVFNDGKYTGLYLDGFEDEEDAFDIPNRVKAISRTDGEEPALVSVAENTDPTSRFSIPYRGRVITHVSEDVEATSQESLDLITLQVLNNMTTSRRKVSFTCAWLPLDLENVVDFHNSEHSIHVRGRIVKIDENLRVPGATLKITLHVIGDL